MKPPYFVRSLILAGVLVLQLSTLCFHSRAAVGDVDLSFDPGSGVNGGVDAIAVQPDGKVIIGGWFTTVKGLARAGIARLNADGSGDSSFNPDSGIGGYVSAIALQPDGKTLVVWNYRTRVSRIDSDGRYDSSFNLYAVGGDYTIIDSLAVQTDGKVLVGGRMVTMTIDPDGYVYYSYTRFVTRVHADGSHDTSFIDSGATANSLALQPDGKILVGGDELIRLKTDGSLDTGFNSDASGLIHSVVAQSDGKVLVGGWYIRTGTNLHAVVRLNADGSLDGSFNSGEGAVGAYHYVESMVVQSDGKVLIGGGFTTFNGTSRNGIARLNSNGSLDSSFDPGVSGSVYLVALQPDGQVLIGGGFTEVNGIICNRVARFNPDGSLDGSFHAGSGVDSSVYSLAVQPDGKVLIGGGFTTVQGLDRSGIARLNANGSLDGSFNVSLNSDDPDNYPPSVVSIAVQSDRKVLIGGSFSAVNGTNVLDGIARLNADGSLDSSFNPGVSGSVSSITLLPDDKVLIGGVFSYNYVNATNYSCGIARLNADGSLDSSFNSGKGAQGVSSVALQPDGKVLIGGPWFAFPGGPGIGPGIARLNANGSLDGSFNGGAAVSLVGYVSSVALQSDGKVLVGGGFSEVNGARRNAIARLNANGTLDDSFTPDIGINSSEYDPVVGSLVVQTDGRVLVGGSFSTINGTNRNGIARLNANGSLDVSFNPGAGVTGGDYPLVKSIVVQSNGNVLIGGSFTTVNGAVRPEVARLYGNAGVPSLNIARSNSFAVLSWPVAFGNFQLQQNTDLSLPNSWSPVAQAAVTNAGQISVTVPAAVGSRFFRLKSQ